MGRFGRSITLVVFFGSLYLVERSFGKDDDFLRQVSLIISKQEKEVYLSLKEEHRKRAFIDAFWKSRDPYPETSRNEFKEKWYRRLEECRLMGADYEWDQRCEMLLLNGSPQVRRVLRCSTLYPIEVWYYSEGENYPYELFVIFYRVNLKKGFKIWYPHEGVGTLFNFPSFTLSRLWNEVNTICPVSDADFIKAALDFVFTQGTLAYSSSVASALKPFPPPGTEWLDKFLGRLAIKREDTKDINLSVYFPSKRGDRTLVTFILPLDKEKISSVVETEEVNLYTLEVIGEVVKNDEMFETFRYLFSYPESVNSPLPVTFDRLLRPGIYRVIVKVVDKGSKREFIADKTIEVPLVEEKDLIESSKANKETASISRVNVFDPRIDYKEETFSYPNFSLSDILGIPIEKGEFKLLLDKNRRYITGNVRVLAISDKKISKVVFTLKGNDTYRVVKTEPPFSVEFNLGKLPVPVILEGVGYNAEGHEIGRDEIVLNSSEHVFRVRILQPGAGFKGKVVPFRIRVDKPQNRKVEYLKLEWNGKPLVTLYQEPWEGVVTLSSEEYGIFKARVRLDDGREDEDSVLINVEGFVEQLEVKVVEIFFSLSKKVSANFTPSDIELYDKGEKRKVLSVERVGSKPFSAVLLIDSSSSMEKLMPEVRKAALYFSKKAVDGGNFVSIMSFNDFVSVISPFTRDYLLLTKAITKLEAERGTALYDAVVRAVASLNGVEGLNAVVLLSDGIDEHSKFSLQEVLSLLRKSKVVVYTLGLGESRKGKSVLRKIASITGGVFYNMRDTTSIEKVYADILNDLESRYRLLFEATFARNEVEFRPIEIKILSMPKVKIFAPEGYFP